MKKVILTLLAVGLLAFTGYSQTVIASPTSPITSGTWVALNTNNTPTLSGPLVDFVGTLAEATNWLVAPFVTYASDTRSWGGGLAAVYNITDTVGTMLRYDYLDSSFNMVSANLQLQAPMVIASTVKVTFFGFTGVATALGGYGEQNGTVQAIMGAGVDFKPLSSKHWSCAFDAEYWTLRSGVQYRFAPFVWRF